MDAGERKCHTLRAQLLLDLNQHVGAISVRQVHGLSVHDNARRRFLLEDEFVQSLTEPIGVGEEQRSIDSRDHDPWDRLQSAVPRDVVVAA